MEIQAVLFDCDGLMFETEIVSQLMWKNLMDRYGVKLPPDFFLKITGASRNDSDAYMRSIPGLEEHLPEIYQRRFDLSFWGHIQNDCLNKKGLLELVSYLETHKYKIAICSSSSVDYVKALLSTVSKPISYDALIGGNQVSHAKPDPEIFLKGAAAVSVSPEHCLVLEDSKQGILAAMRAGMHRCFIPDTIVPDEEMKEAMEFQCSDLSQVIDLLKQSRQGNCLPQERTI